MAVLASGCVVYENLFPEPREPVRAGDEVEERALAARLGQPLGTVRLGFTEYMRFSQGVLAVQGGHVVKTWPAKPGLLYDIEVDARASDGGGSRVLIAPVPPLEAGTLEFAEATRYLSPILEAVGYEVSSDAEEVDLVVAVGFGVSDPHEWTELSYRPVVNYVPSQTTRFHATCDGCVTVRGAFETEGHLETRYVAETRRRRSYVRFLDLTAVDAALLRRGGEAREVWTVRVRSEGPSGDLRLVLPVMLAAAWPRIAQDSGHRESERYSDQSVRVVAVRHAAQARP